MRLRPAGYFVCCVLLLVHGAFAAEMPVERQHEILSQALRAFDDAVDAAREQPNRAQELYREAAAGFEALRAAGVHNAALEYNLGNTYFRLGELGKAIAHYRRAQRLDPHDDKLAANLTYARRRVEPYLEPTGQRRLARSLAFLHYSLSLNTRYWIATVLSVGGWLILAAWLFRRRRAAFVSGIGCVLLGLSFAGSVAWQLHELETRPPAVVVGEGASLRLGPGAGYEAAIEQPLGAGVEVIVLQERVDWAEVRLANEQTGWLPAGALLRI